MGINEQDLTNAKGWRPEEGDSIIGTIVSVDSGWSDQANEFYPILTIAPKDGGDAVAVHCFHHVLKGKVLSARPQVGAEIGIKYEGKTESKDGRRQIAVYAVRIEGGSSDPYAAFGAPAAPAVQSDIPNTVAVQPADDKEDIPF